MWVSEISKRDFYEVAFSGVKPKLIENCLEIKGMPNLCTNSELLIIWSQKPRNIFDFPNLVISRDDEINDILSAINSSPQAFTPVSAYSRIISFSDAKLYMSEKMIRVDDRLLVALATMSMIETHYHSGGKIKLQNISPAACRRTISYVWATAVASKVPISIIKRIPERWLETYYALNSGEQSENVHFVVNSLLPTLFSMIDTQSNFEFEFSAFNLCKALVENDVKAIGSAWNEISRVLKIGVTYEALLGASREDRGALLHFTINIPERNNLQIEREIAVAFLAVQVAPGTLEHLEFLKLHSSVNTVFWYGLFAALCSPLKIQALQSGFVRRLLRDISSTNELTSPVHADLSYEELFVINQSSREELGKRITHSGEIEIELFPLAKAAFRFSTRQNYKKDSLSQSDLFSLENLTASEKLNKISESILEITRELEKRQISKKRPRRRITRG